MKKVIVIPDSFKGTLSASQVCDIISERIKIHFPECQIIAIPIADGGEGSIQCFLRAMGGRMINARCSDPFFQPMTGQYGILDDGSAVIEMAVCSGLPLVENKKNPMLTTTYGVGELMLDALKHGCSKLIVCLGGSCTNDCGCGMASALGVKFFDKFRNVFIPTGGTLKNVYHIDSEELNPILKEIPISVMCDINNPLYGTNGAAYIFAPQKGANDEQCKLLDEGLKHISDIIKQDLGIDISKLPGGGAAGGMGAGISAFLNAELKMGIEVLLDAIKFNDLLKGADMVFTGEGRMDSQSLGGKAVIGVAYRAKKQNVPVIVLTGGIQGDIAKAYNLGVSAVFSINRLPEDLSISKNKSPQNLSNTIDDILRLIKLMEKNN